MTPLAEPPAGDQAQVPAIPDAEPRYARMADTDYWTTLDLAFDPIHDDGLWLLDEDDAARLRALWPDYLPDLQAIYEARGGHISSASVVTALAVIQDAIRRGRGFDERAIARRSRADLDTAHRVITFLRAAGLLPSEVAVLRRGTATSRRDTAA